MCLSESVNFCAVKALIKFKESINGDPLLVLSNWNASDSDPCHWKGISCSKAGDHVIKMYEVFFDFRALSAFGMSFLCSNVFTFCSNISGASLKGSLAPELYLISNLQEL